MGTDFEGWFQPSLVIAIVLSSIAGATLYIEWAIDRKLSEHQLETSRAVADRFEQFHKMEKDMEVQLAEIKLRLSHIENCSKGESSK